MAENHVIVEAGIGQSLPVSIADVVPSVAPDRSRVLAGSLTAAGDLISVPSGMSWYGWISLAVSVTGASQSCSVSVATVGNGGLPADTVTIVGTTATTGTANVSAVSSNRTPYMYIQAGDPEDIAVHLSVTGTGVVSAAAYGFIVNN